MKYQSGNCHHQTQTVAPFAGAWIEIINIDTSLTNSSVAPFAGAWIEIDMQYDSDKDAKVAPFAGAWIEISEVL